MATITQIEQYWDQQPCNIKHGLAPEGTEEFWNNINRRRWFVGPHLWQLADFENCKGRRVLELGCGIGSDAEQFVRHGAEYVGIDLSSRSIELCEQRFAVMGLDAEFHHMDAGDSQRVAGLGQFDMVYACGVLHHYPNVEQVVSNAYASLASGGEFRFLVYARNSWKWAMIQSGLDQFEAQDNCPYARVYSQEEIQKLLDVHFDIKSIKQDYCFMYNVEQYKQGNYVLEPWFAAMSDAQRQAINQHLGWHLSVIAAKQ